MLIQYLRPLQIASRRAHHWQARDEYLSDIKQGKQGKQQTTAELDIYIKNLVRRCQFKQAEQEPHKIDLLYHATAHFEVKKFVYNTKPEELTCDKMIEVVKAHERTCHEYQIHKQAHFVAPPPPVITLILCFKQVLCQSLFRNALPRRPVANADAHTTKVNAQPLVLYAALTLGYDSSGSQKLFLQIMRITFVMYIAMTRFRDGMETS